MRLFTNRNFFVHPIFRYFRKNKVYFPYKFTGLLRYARNDEISLRHCEGDVIVRNEATEAIYKIFIRLCVIQQIHVTLQIIMNYKL